MKIRTDFVTNSSSSCFCVSLKMEFDNGKEVTMYGSREDGDGEYYSCDNFGHKDTIHNLNDLANGFSDLAGARDDIGKVMGILQRKFGIKNLEALSEATKMTDAEMKVSACVRGEYSYEAEPSRMLGIDDSSVPENFTEEAREAIEGSEEDDGSKSYTLYLNEDGMVDVEYSEGEEYTPKQFEADDIGEIFNGSYLIELDDVFGDLKESVIRWAEKNGYDLSLSEDDDEETFFSSLGFDGVFIDDTMITLDGELDDCTSLGYPIIELLAIFAEYTSGNLGTFYTENGPVSIEAEDGGLSIEAEE